SLRPRTLFPAPARRYAPRRQPRPRAIARRRGDLEGIGRKHEAVLRALAMSLFPSVGRSVGEWRSRELLHLRREEVVALERGEVVAAELEERPLRVEHVDEPEAALPVG